MSTGPMPEPGSRALWALFEPIHAAGSYFGGPTRQAFEAAGVRGFWRSYFAARAAPLGRPSSSLVVALFFGFAPRMVERAVPAVWDVVAPEAALRLREEGAVATLSGLPGWDADSSALREAADLARAAVGAAAVEGRALGAANAALPWPEEPTAVLWQAATVLRELRGDGHVAALLAAGLSGLDSIVLRAGLDVDPSLQQAARGWTDEEWRAECDDLRARGLVDEEARVTTAGWLVLREVENVTNDLAEQPWRELGDRGTARFADVVRPFAEAAVRALPPNTPLGLLTPEGPWAQRP